MSSSLSPPSSAADILIVDDTPNNLRLLSVMLTENGYKVRKAINGERALQAVRAIPPDLILLDIKMPDMDGYEVCRQLKQDGATCAIPVIFLSALDDVFDKVAAFEAGGVDYITKPFQIQEVLVRIHTHLNSCRLQHQLEERNTQLQQEISDRITAENALKIFLHAVSHDLRNPVTGCSMVLKNLLAQSSDVLNIPRPILERMLESNERQLQLIESLIESHAAEVKGIVIHPESTRLRDLVAAAIADLQPMLLKENATLVNLIPDHLPSIHVDPLQITRIYQNLIANALKHNPPGLTITLNAGNQACSEHILSSSNSPPSLLCTVSDNGIGITSEQQEKLFDLYFQGSQKRKSVGLGLGLYLCQQIVQAHGGAIGVQSQSGSGATFWFTLPLAP